MARNLILGKAGDDPRPKKTGRRRSHHDAFTGSAMLDDDKFELEEATPSYLIFEREAL